MEKKVFKKFDDRNSVVGSNYTTSISTKGNVYLSDLNMTFNLDTITEKQIETILAHKLYGSRYFQKIESKTPPTTGDKTSSTPAKKN